ncbi:MAG: hypothetical protein JWQ85_1923 [Mucilaginibacter sp.]|nr:hypothetical protein [Mucilaginibacter sp.]
MLKSGWRDSNPRPPAPHADAIPGYATSRSWVTNIITGIKNKKVPRGTILSLN